MKTKVRTVKGRNTVLLTLRQINRAGYGFGSIYGSGRVRSGLLINPPVSRGRVKLPSSPGSYHARAFGTVKNTTACT